MPSAMAALKKIAKATPAGQWIEARQIDPSLQVGGDPTVTVLDNISASQPIFLLNASGHLAYCNSKLLELAGITKDTPDLDGWKASLRGMTVASGTRGSLFCYWRTRFCDVK